jgi:nucleoside-diphosphate-sugar epimerase
MIARMTGRKARLRLIDGVPGEARTNTADLTKARRLLKYEPSYALRDGLREQILSQEAFASRDRAAIARAGPRV